jgi:chromosome segregation ATPase
MSAKALPTDSDARRTYGALTVSAIDELQQLRSGNPDLLILEERVQGLNSQLDSANDFIVSLQSELSQGSCQNDLYHSVLIKGYSALTELARNMKTFGLLIEDQMKAPSRKFAAFERKFSSLREKNIALRAGDAEKKVEIDRLRAVIKGNCEKALAQAEENRLLFEKLNEKAQENRRLQSKLDDQSAVAKIEADLKERNESVAKLTEEVKGLAAQNAATMEENKGLIAKLSERTQENGRLQLELESLSAEQARMVDIEQQNTSLQSDLKDRNESVAKMTEENRGLIAKLSETTEENKRLQSKLESLSEEQARIVELERRKASLESDLKERNAMVERLEHRNEAERKSFSEAQRSGAGLAKELLQLQERRSVLDADLLNAKIELQKRDNAIAELTETVQHCKEREAKLRDAELTQREAVLAHQEDVRQLSEEVRELSVANENLSDELKAARLSIASAKAQLEELQQETAAFESRDEVRQELEATVSANFKELGRLA